MVTPRLIAGMFGTNIVQWFRWNCESRKLDEVDEIKEWDGSRPEVDHLDEDDDDENKYVLSAGAMSPHIRRRGKKSGMHRFWPAASVPPPHPNRARPESLCGAPGAVAARPEPLMAGRLCTLRCLLPWFAASLPQA